jgi:TonB-linked SusC/RagA family outer membrane protein
MPAVKIVILLLVCELALPAYSLIPDNPSGNNLPGSAAYQQQIKVSGTVTDMSNSQAMPGVNIQIKGSTVGAISDVDGKFTLTVSNPDATLVFSFIGYVTREVALDGQTTINVDLTPQVSQLSEVVVVGYGTQKKVTATGSVTSAKGTELVKSPATNLSNNLIGRMPGLTAITQSGEPGMDDAVLLVRGTNTLGNNSPLIVVDGVANRGMNRLNPNDIENITVLKDASAAIYGSEAANGVILITTKRGIIGKPKITIGMNAGVTQPTKIPEMANAAQYATMLNEIAYYGTPSLGLFQKYSAADIQKYTDGSDPWGHPDTDWFGAVFNPWAGQNQANASITGGTDNMKYFLSLGARFEDGIYKNSATNYKQYDFRTNIDGKVNKYINIGFDISGREELRNYPTVNAGNIFRMLMRGKPNQPAYWPSGDPGPDIEYGFNPAVVATSATGYNNTKTYVLQSNLHTLIEIPWISGLSIMANASFDKTILFHKEFETPWYLYTWDGNPDHILTKFKTGLASPQLTEDMADGLNININAYATYEKTLSEKHTIKVMAGTERRSGTNDVFSAFRKNYISTAVDQLFAGASDQYMSNNGSGSQNAYVSYFGRVNYDLSRKYILEFVWRYDGSYMFPRDQRFGFFPGVSAGWRISEESFWKNNLAFFNDFKIRGSWGQTGNDRIAEYQYLATYGFSNRTYVFRSTESKLLNETKIPNLNVTWEVANQANIGFDALLFNSKVSVSADYFNNIRSHILIAQNASVPGSSGLVGMLPPVNIGKVQNRGFEGMIGYRGQAGDIDYDLSLNGSYSKNKILFWDETPGIPAYQQSTGRPIGSALYYEATGIFKDEAALDAYPHWAGAQPGDIIFKDVNSDGKIDGLDRVMNDKNNFPRFISGATINLRHKGFDVTILVQGATGAEQYIFSESGEIGDFYKEFADNRWTPENITASFPRTFNRNNEYWVNYDNTFWLYNMNYVRLKNFEIGYSLPSGVNKTLGIEGLRFYVNGLNLLTLSKQKYIDPEAAAGNGQSYPLNRVVTGGITLTF